MHPSSSSVGMNFAYKLARHARRYLFLTEFPILICASQMRDATIRVAVITVAASAVQEHYVPVSSLHSSLLSGVAKICGKWLPTDR